MRDGQRLHVRILGRGAPCMLVHGFASDSGAWLPFIAPLLHRHRFILPDLRGFGASRGVPLQGDCPLSCYAQDLADVAAALQLEKLPVGGMSMGALSLAQAFRLGEARRFGRYLHIDQGPVIHNRAGSEHGLMGAGQRQFFARMRALVDALDAQRELSYAALPAALTRRMASVFAEFASAAFSALPLQRAARSLTAEPRLLRYFLPQAGFRTYVQIMRAYLERDYDLRDAFREVRVPLTVLIGGASRMYPPPGQQIIAQFATHAAVRELPGVGHMLPLEAPRRFLRELTHFLGS